MKLYLKSTSLYMCTLQLLANLTDDAQANAMLLMTFEEILAALLSLLSCAASPLSRHGSRLTKE